MTRIVLTLSNDESKSLATFIADNLGESVEILTENISGIGENTYVQVTGRPRTRQDITDYGCW